MNEQSTFVLDWETPATPARSPSLPPTKSEQRLWEYYLSLGPEFHRSLKRIASETGLKQSTVQRANQRFRELGQLSWETGHGNREAKALGETNLYRVQTSIGDS